mgnify:CR=1 FL=1
MDVAEAENFLLEENIVKAIAIHMGRNADEVFQQVKENLISFFSSQIEAQILLHFKEILRRIYLGLTNFAEKEIGLVISEIDTTFTSIDKQKIYDDTKSEFEAVIATKDYNAILRLFNLKDALIPQSKVCDLTGIKNKEEYLKLVVSLLKRNDATSITIKESINNKIIKNAT